MNRNVIPKLQSWPAMRAEFEWNIPEYFNIAERCCDSWAALNPNKIAIIHIAENGRRIEWSYGQLKRASDALAASLRAKGVGQGDRVAVLLAQSPEVMITHMATYKLGAIVLPLFTLFGPDALSYRLCDSGARALITDRQNFDKVEALLPNLPNLSEVYLTDGGAPPYHDFLSEIEASHRFRAVQTRAEDPACLIYTSGTTGDPKGVLHAHRFLFGHLPAVEAQYRGFATEGAVGWTPADWAWIGGLMDLAMPSLYYGVPLISYRMRRFEPEEAMRLLAQEAVTSAFLPPTALKLMRNTPVPANMRLGAVMSGGESLGPDLLDWGKTQLGADINEAYGQTECNLVLGTGHGLMPIRPGSVGFAIPGSNVSIIDETGRELPPGEMGEIAVKRPDPVMFLRYWNKPEKTAEKFVGDWMRTGDLGRKDAEGYFWYESRDDDVITSSGYRIGPTEIENCLAGHADVVMAAVIGVPDPIRTEAVKAYVVLRDGAEWAGLEAALIARVKERISPHLAPRMVEKIDTLPMTATGKIMRRALRS